MSDKPSRAPRSVILPCFLVNLQDFTPSLRALSLKAAACLSAYEAIHE
jgi:hypothetical protein